MVYSCYSTIRLWHVPNLDVILCRRHTKFHCKSKLTSASRVKPIYEPTHLNLQAGGGMCFRNVVIRLQIYTVSQPRTRSCGNGNALDSYWGDAWFESRPGHRLYWLRVLIVLLSSSGEKSECYLDKAVITLTNFVMVSFFKGHETNILYSFIISLMPATCLTHLIRLNMIIIIISCEDRKLSKFSLRNFFESLS
jgi:hypothetical protein